MVTKGRNLNMVIPTAIMGILAIILILIGYYRGEGQHISGMKTVINMVIQILLLLFFSFIVASMVQVLNPGASIGTLLHS